MINDILSRGGDVDVLISLDGFNEIALPEARGNLSNGISPFYPQHWRELVETKLSPAQVDWQVRARFILDLRVCLASIFAKPILRHSITANFIWRVADVRLTGLAEAYRKWAEEKTPIDPASKLSNDQRAFLGPVVEYDTRRDLYMDIARNWGRSSVLLNNIMATLDGLYFHFLQPNQYVAGSKYLGEREKRICYPPKQSFTELRLKSVILIFRQKGRACIVRAFGSKISRPCSRM